jgi:hypothetical protein
LVSQVSLDPLGNYCVSLGADGRLFFIDARGGAFPIRVLGTFAMCPLLATQVHCLAWSDARYLEEQRLLVSAGLGDVYFLRLPQPKHEPEGSDWSLTSDQLEVQVPANPPHVALNPPHCATEHGVLLLGYVVWSC